MEWYCEDGEMAFDLCDNIYEEGVIIVFWFGQICRVHESSTLLFFQLQRNVHIL